MATGTSGAVPAIAGALRARGPLTRADVMAVTGLSRATISATVSDLVRQGLAEDREDGAVATGGRPAARVTLTAAAGVVIGVDLGRRHIRVAAADLGHVVLAEQERRFDVDGRPGAAIRAAAELVAEVLAAAGVPASRVLGVGLGLPAPIDNSGRLGSTSILPGWVGHQPAEELGDLLGMVVRADNDANLGALAESQWGAGHGAAALIYVKAATGIGGGIVLDGVLYRGASSTAGEIGHVTVADNAAVCRCGNRGCLELFAGGPALVAQVSHGPERVESVPDLVAAAQAGSAGCRRVLEDAGDALGLALSSLVNVLNPDRIVIGGELGLAGELVLASLRARVRRSAMTVAAQAVTVVAGTLGDRAEVLGGLLMVLREPARFSDGCPILLSA